MTAQKNGTTILESLETADREFAVGNYRESSRILADAAEATYELLAEAHGLDPSDHIATADALDGEDGIIYNGYLITAGLLRDHAEMDVLEFYELEWPHEMLPPFIRGCLDELTVNDKPR